MTVCDGEQKRMVVFATANRPARRLDAETDPESDDERVGLLGEYLGIERRTLFVFLGLVIGAFVAATITYGAICGFRKWATNMQRVGSLMVINCPTCGASVNTPGTGGTP